MTQNQLKQKIVNELENHHQKLSSNIKDKSSRKVKKSKQRNLPKNKAKVIFKPMQNLSDVTNRRKKHNKEITLALQNLNQESDHEVAVNDQRQSNNCEKRVQSGNANNQDTSVTNPSRETNENQQESIQESDVQNGNEDPKNRQKEKKTLNIRDYVNESTSVPSEIKNLPRTDMVVDLNMEPNPKQDKYVTSQQIEVTFPNMVTIIIPEDQLQTDLNEGSFQIIGGKENRKLKGRKNKSKDTTPPKGGHSC
uniref:Ribonuclease 3-like n=1 Tax=Nicotiana tabacum TaxID=4097 RepID=A0A1S3X5Y8_TOBAC|nr:PREDICTED: ribonuclease 3-like [Nicotiana tabacum]